ncbi:MULTISPECIES: LytTR family DNA-binding domain-containing protein [unclassified Lysinibacillus]|uniref:LytTR family DNA-binding domain-containing protein n=1 Tax=unclassified Lysinibacillus TaxID=2636778 RepID=UPI002011BCE0|nr:MULTISPECIES: LytTR family DNA-binding domain-containing protein [unclassified Lysinibacillus]MCL1698323.1 LytTR family transcriptional regulator [Lysinibacillus sp. BPa_S21]MCL1703330.1 LytTR family transcriptional regulator [Lysinibacillus sp. Bpr_S20]
MKFNYIWKNNQPSSEIEIISNPSNKELLSTIEQRFFQSITLSATDFKTNRQVMIELKDIEAIEASGHFTKIFLINGTELLLNKILKELSYLESFGLVRINNSMILNLNQIHSFASGSHARLEVITKQQNKYIVSRHYAKSIKEKLI